MTVRNVFNPTFTGISRNLETLPGFDFYAIQLESKLDRTEVETVLTGAIFSDFISRIGMAHDTAGRVVPQHPFYTRRGGIAAIAADHEPGMLGVTHADTATVVERYPGCATRSTQQQV